MNKPIHVGSIKQRNHRGYTSLFESVACVALAGVLIVLMLRIVSYSALINSESQRAASAKIDVDYLVETLQTDIKSSTLIDIDGDQLRLVVLNQIILYRFEGTTLYRDDESILNEVASVMYTPVDGNSVGVYICYGRDAIIDLMISR